MEPKLISFPLGLDTKISLLFKPKTAKDQTPRPVLLIAAETSSTSIKTIEKELKIKDVRAASEEIWQEFLSCSKNSCQFLAS